MSYNGQPPPGFVLPNNAPVPAAPGHYPQYPSPHGQPAHGHPPAYQGYPQYPPAHQPFPPPVQQQPGSYAPQHWVNSNFQDYMRNAVSFHVKQKVEMIEAILGWETGNKYTVKDQAGNKVFYVGEDSNLCARQCCNQSRSITLSVKDSAGMNVLTMERPLDCSCFCGLFCPDQLTVSTSNGQILGSVIEDFHILQPSFSIRDHAGRTVLRIEGPMCPITFGSCMGPVVFKVMNNNGVSVGTISKEWSGLVRELFTDADYFSMSFPIDLDPAIKAVCLGALFLIDYQYFEKGTFKDNQGGRRLFA